MTPIERFSERLVMNFFTEPTLIALAAKAKELVLDSERSKPEKHEFISTIFGRFTVGDDLILKLKGFGFTFGAGSREDNRHMRYLDSNLPQAPGASFHDSTVWCWDASQTERFFDVRMHLSTDQFYRGVICSPNFWGNNKGGPSHRGTLNKFTNALANISPDTDLIGEMKNDPFIVVHWGDIGFAGIKQIGVLFEELYGKNEKVLELSRTQVSPFAPCPQDKGALYIPEPYQPDLFRLWMHQLEEYKRTL